MLPVSHAPPDAPLPTVVNRLQQEDDNLDGLPQDNAGLENSHFGGLKLIERPPDLDQWRERLFRVDETITLSEEQ